MMFDSVDVGRKPLAGKPCGEQVRDGLACPTSLDAVDDQPEVWAVRYHVSKLAMEIGPAVLVDGDVLDISKSNAGFPKAIGDRLGRKPGPVLHSAKPLLFRCGQELAVANKGRGGVPMEGIETEDDHLVGPPMATQASFFATRNRWLCQRY